MSLVAVLDGGNLEPGIQRPLRVWRVMACVCGHGATKSRGCLQPWVPSWRPGVRGPGASCRVLGGCPWGPKLHDLRPGTPLARASGHPGLSSRWAEPALRGSSPGQGPDSRRRPHSGSTGPEKDGHPGARAVTTLRRFPEDVYQWLCTLPDLTPSEWSPLAGPPVALSAGLGGVWLPG